MRAGLSFARGFALHLLLASIAFRASPYRPKRAKRRLNLDSAVRRRLVGANGLRP
jgi:hypothetical protein